jgi:hypothetical protein
MAIALWSVWLRTPLYARLERARWQQQLARTLGVAVEIAAIRQPSPGRFVLEGVTLRDPDAPARRLPLAHLSRVDVLRRSGTLLVLASQADVSHDDVPRLWSILHERLVRGPDILGSRVHVGIGSVTLASQAPAPPPLALTDLRAVVQSGPSMARIEIQFVPAAAQQPIRLDVARDRTQYPVTTDWVLDTHGSHLPASLLAAVVPAFQQLGSAAVFQGQLQLRTSDRSWDAYIASGMFHRVDLAALTGNQYAGTEAVVLSHAQWRAGAMVSAEESVTLAQSRDSAVALAQALLADGERFSVRQLLHTLRRPR